MVDVGGKPITERVAAAKGEIHMKRATFELIRDGALKKGDVLTVGQIAGITAAASRPRGKQASRWKR
jgi:cyclic pyranopterin phosphate synthase